MKPPPPIPHEEGLATHTASPVATAASTALPPALRIRTPASAPNGCSAATIACLAITAGAAPAAASTSHSAARRLTRLFHIIRFIHVHGVELPGRVPKADPLQQLRARPVFVTAIGAGRKCREAWPRSLSGPFWKADGADKLNQHNAVRESGPRASGAYFSGRA